MSDDRCIDFRVWESVGVPVFWPAKEGTLLPIREEDGVKEGDEVWVPDLCGRGYMPMKVTNSGQGLMAKGERLSASLSYEDGELRCTCLFNMDAVRNLELRRS